MAVEDPQRTFDGTDSWAGGMDSGKRGSLIGLDQYQEGGNVICRGGNIATRPKWLKLTTDYQNTVNYSVASGDLDGAAPVRTTTEAFGSDLFQGALYYDPPDDEASIIAMIGGRLFKLVPRRTTAEVTEIPLPRQNRSNIPIAYLVQADRFMLIQDGESSCIIYDGVTARRAGKDEIPVGTIMSYGMGRVVLVGNNFKDILFGDLYGSHAGAPGDSVIRFTETTFLSEGGAASVPSVLGHIRCLFFYPQQDTSVGQGELVVAAENGVATFFLSLPRDQWKTSQFQKIGLIAVGARGHRAFAPFNEDAWFRAGDGWRAYRQARAVPAGWYQLPLSVEMSKFLDVENQDLLRYASAIRFDNRLIATCNPVPNQGRLYHNGLVSLDFNVLSSFGQARKPSWDGHWSGIKVLQLVEGNFRGDHRAFAFGLDNGVNVLYELRSDRTEDSSGPVTSYVVPRTFNFQQPFNETKSCDLDLWTESVKRTTSLNVYFKPDRYQAWLPWNASTNIPVQGPVVNFGTLAGIPTVVDGFRPRLGLGTPLTGYDTLSTKRDFKRFYEVDLKIEWTGDMAIKQIRLHDKSQVEKATSNRV